MGCLLFCVGVSRAVSLSLSLSLPLSLSLYFPVLPVMHMGCCMFCCYDLLLVMFCPWAVVLLPPPDGTRETPESDNATYEPSTALRTVPEPHVTQSCSRPADPPRYA